MKTARVRVVNGDVILLHSSENNIPLCPICGGDLAEPSYTSDGDPNSWASPSHQFCFCCNSQFGFDDMIGSSSPHGQLLDHWKRLRLEWLDKAGWSEANFAQLLKIDIGMENLKKETGK